MNPNLENEKKWLQIANDFSISHPQMLSAKQMLIDITGYLDLDLKKEIPHNIRLFLLTLLNNPPEGYRIEPVYSSDSVYRYAQRFTLEFLNCPMDGFNDDPVEYQQGDCFVMLDWTSRKSSLNENYFNHIQQQGVEVYCTIYDLQSISLSDCFSQVDGVICSSQAVADEFKLWLDKRQPNLERSLKIRYLRFDADVSDNALLLE